jgi:hypothetical protein
VTVQAPLHNWLSIVKSGTGSGTVTSDDGKINCGDNCGGDYPNDTFINLTATAAPGSAFIGWSGDCTGTGVCPGTMDAAKNVGATFNSVPFTATTTGVINGIITDAIATVTTAITVKPDDVGQIRSVFITALVPASFLEIWVAPQSFKSMTHPDALILVQRTPSGWQQVVNGELIPYFTGVLSEQSAVLTVLDSTDTTTLRGSQFCVGYGVDASDMAATGKMQLIATKPDPYAINNNTGTCLLPPLQSMR